MDIPELSTALAKALGVTDLKGVTRVTLVIECGEFPTVTVDRHLRVDDFNELQAVCATYKLKPSEA